MKHTEDELIEMFTKHHYVEGWSVTSFAHKLRSGERKFTEYRKAYPRFHALVLKAGNDAQARKQHSRRIDK